MSPTRLRIPKALTTTLTWALTPPGMGGFVSAGRSARAGVTFKGAFDVFVSCGGIFLLLTARFLLSG